MASDESVAAELRKWSEHVQEYWNGNHNERAMSDALEHILDECLPELEPLIARLEAPGPALEELRKLVEKATPGEWQLNTEGDDGRNKHIIISNMQGPYYVVIRDTESDKLGRRQQDEKDYALVVAAVNYVKQLLERKP